MPKGPLSVVWHGIFAGPWYASLSARGGTGPALPVIYALALQLAFNALLQVAFGLEDPCARGRRPRPPRLRPCAGARAEIKNSRARDPVFWFTSRARRRWSAPRGKRACPGTPTWASSGKNVSVS